MSTKAIVMAVTSFTVCPRLTMLALAYVGEMGVRTMTWGINRIVFGPPPPALAAETVRSVLRHELKQHRNA
jgi:hypothetical protein